ncbi:MAG TPA: hypothetical protein VFU72_03035 [Nitrolancea sp.]|nr:hypothetical protein [Nitrolancea sp.]
MEELTFSLVHDLGCRPQGSSGGGIGFAGLLTIVFITLKLTGYIHWPWL